MRKHSISGLSLLRSASIRTHLLLLVVAVSLPLALAVGYSIYSDMQQSIARTKTELRTMVSTMINNTGGKIQDVHRMLKHLGDRPLVRQIDAAHCDGLLKDLLGLNPDYANVAYTNLQGLVVCSAVPQPGGRPANVGNSPWFQKFVQEQRPTVGDPFLGPITDKWVSVLSSPIRNGHQEMIGGIHLPLDLAAFDPHIPTQLLPADSRYGFMSQDGVLIWRDYDPEHLVGTRIQTEAAQRMLQARNGEYESTGVDGVRRFFSVAPMPETGWIAWVGVPVSDVYGAARQRAIIASGIALAAMLVLLLAAIGLARRIATPIVTLEKVARAIQGGDTEAKADEAGPSDIAAVAQAFNAMINGQKMVEARLQSIFDASPDALIISDEQGTITQANQQVNVLLGYQVSELIGLSIDDLVPQRYRTNHPALRGKFTALPSARRMGHGREIKARRKDGSECDVEIGLSQIQTDQGLLVATSLHDISEHKLAERALRESEERFRCLTEMSSDFYWESDAEHRLTQRTESKREAEEEVFRQMSPVGKRRWEIPYTSPDEAGWLAHRALLDAHLPFRGFEIARPRVNGTVHYIVISGDPVFDAAGEFTGYRGVGKDITGIKLAETDLRIAAAAFESQEGMVVTDANTVILRINQAFTESTGYTAEEAVGQTPRLLNSGHHDKAFFAEMWASINRSGSWQGEIWDRRKNGEIFPKWLTITAVKSDAGKVTHYVGTHTDITARKAAEDEIKNLAFYDSLTRLPNRRLLRDRLRQALASSARSGRKGALLFIDLDNFKTLNDTLGHDKGDLLLQQVAERLETCVREGDTVARLGGDEFVVMLEELSVNPEEAATQSELVGEKVLAMFHEPFFLVGHKHHSSPSIGVTLFSGHQNSIEELLKQADLAMYQSKTAGRNTLRFFDAEMQALVSDRAALEVELREAVRQQQFILYYQPQVVDEGRLTGAEALVRWRHPVRGIVSPADFITLAEDTGLILPLGHWVLETACKQLAIWADQPAMADISMSVNISASQLNQTDFVDHVLAVLKSTRANPQRLKLELTESLLLANIENTITKMAALKVLGVGFSLDDFGSGYSSLSYLKRLPLDQLKIDQGFVRDILVDQNDAAIAKMVVALANSMGLSVIAEGVETVAQREFLARQGCHAYQGYLFARPLPLVEFVEYVRRLGAMIDDTAEAVRTL